MKTKNLFALAALLILASHSTAQVVIQRPFVRLMFGGGGVHVQAPFVNLFLPRVPPPPGLIAAQVPEAVFPSRPRLIPPLTIDLKTGAEIKPEIKSEEPSEETAPAPRAVSEKKLSLKDFAETFQPRGGNYSVSIINPVNKQLTPVRFSLPEGTPREVRVMSESVEFNYGPQQFVRIQFDKDGAIVTSR